jgi:hypothetical protein
MNAPQPTAAQVDVGDAFGYVFRSRNWFGKLAVGALCLVFFWLLFIPLFLLLGYFVEAARTVSRGGRELPPWTDLGKKLGDGFLLGIALFVWGLPGTILSSGGSGFHCVQSSCSYQAGPLAPLGALYGLLIAVLTAAIWSQFLAGGFAGAFDFRAVFRRALQDPGMTVIVWLVASVLGTIIALAGFILLLIGFLFTLPYAFALSANLYGQFAQRTQGAAGVAPAL